ncbi:helix-turn-helix domain-containing protein [Thermopolyspora sp. NPDC052614]|uniref:helix-turn-helix domain-containing protein n=1 Tax=Thermopolyspora sp. NPDC052614 TaxID=3155682 RepID=UPI003432FEF7
MTTRDLISKRIKEIRRQRGLSQAQLAHPELSDSYISLIESGSRTPTPAVLELIASKLDCSVSYLVNGVTAEEMEELELTLRYARMALENGEIAEARKRYTELLANPVLPSLTSLRLEAEYGAALAAEACGELQEAINLLTRIRDSAEELMTDERRVAVAIALSRCYHDLGETALAIEVAEKEISQMSGAGWTDELIELGSTLLASYFDRGDLLRAHHYAKELLSAAEALGTPRAIVAANWNAAHVADLLGNGEEAVPLAERAMVVQSENGEPRNIARLRTAYAAIRLRNRPDESAACRDLLLRAERELRESASSTLDLAFCLQHLAIAELGLGHVELAIDYAQRAIDLLENHPDVRADVQVILGQAYLLLGRRREAAAQVNAAIEVMELGPIQRTTAESWLTAAAVLEGAGDQENSAIAYMRAMECGGL